MPFVNLKSFPAQPNLLLLIFLGSRWGARFYQYDALYQYDTFYQYDTPSGFAFSMKRAIFICYQYVTPSGFAFSMNGGNLLSLKFYTF